jgi:hypothetical protein
MAQKPTTAAAKRASGSRAKPQSPGRQSPGSRADRPGDQPQSPGSPGSPGDQETPAKARAEDARAASGAGSSTASSGFGLGNAGPAFAGRDTGPPADPDGGVAAADPLLLTAPDWWTDARAEKVLKAQGALTHAFIGVGETDWRWAPAELDAVAQPMADSFNRVELLRRLAPYADAIGAVGGIVAYTKRSLRVRSQVLGGRVVVEEPITGATADVPTAWHTEPAPAAAPPEPEPEQRERRQTALDHVLRRGRGSNTEPVDPGDVEWRIE